MNKITLPTLFFFIISMISFQVKAQDGYTYTLIDNGSYNFTIAAVPNASASNFATSVQSYGFTILVPDGVTASITSSLGNGASATFFDGNNVAQPTLDGYLITETLGSPMALPAPSTGMNSSIVTIQINGSPNSGGMLSILANDSALANAVTPLKSFMQADMIDDAMASFTNVVDPNASGLSGVTSFTFPTLSTPDVNVEQFSIYPNPAKDIVHIKGTDTLTALEIYNSTGQLVITKRNNLNTFNVSQLKSGVYFVKAYTDNAQKTFKIIKQ